VTSRVSKDRWVISEGLKPGERVVVDGFQKLRPGAKVTPQPWVSPATRSATSADSSTTSQ